MPGPIQSFKENVVPRHIRNIAIAALLVILAIAAAINSYTHYQFQKNIDHALGAIRPIVHIKYDELSTSPFSGEVILENIRFSSPFTAEEMILGDVTLDTPGFPYMLTGADSIKEGHLPQQLGFSLDNFYFDLSSETAELLDNIVQRMQPLYASDPKICAGKSILGPKEYKEMGYSRLLTNMRIAYDYSEDDQSLSIQLAVNTKNMANIEANFKLANITSISTSNLIQGPSPTLSQLDIVYQDKTYTPRVIRYCSESGKMKKEAYINAEVSQPDSHFYKLLGFAPGKGLREAYKDFLSKPDVVTLSMTPGKNFNPQTAATLSNEELIKALKLKLKINGLLVKDLSYSKAPAQFTAEFERQLTESLNIESLLRGEKVKPAEVVKEEKVVKKAAATYHPIELADISKHVGSFVKIVTENDNERNGQLIRMDEFNLYVEKKVSGGRFTMTVPIKKIKSVKAYFSK